MDDFMAIVLVLDEKDILEAEIKNIWDLEKAIAKGLPVRALERLIEKIYPHQDRKLYEIIPRSTWRNRQRSGYLNFYESEKTARIARVYGQMLDIWSTKEQAARLFMQTPHQLLKISLLSMSARLSWEQEWWSKYYMQSNTEYSFRK